MDREKFSDYVSGLAIKAILYEAIASPKPGLVDRFNSGAHDDMDIFTFLSSASVLFPYFSQCTRAGLEFEGDNYRELMDSLRPIGIRAEELMFKETAGVNTHKGAIFSLGIIAGAAGSIYKEEAKKYMNIESLIARIRKMTKRISKELEGSQEKESLSYGEKLYLKYQIRGARGEAESGFKTAIDHSLPRLEKLVEEGKYDINDILVDCLIYLIAHTEDSNILGRHNPETLKYAQERAGEILNMGGYLSREGKLAVQSLDRDFIEKNISPGGGADLLAVTLFLYFLKKGALI